MSEYDYFDAFACERAAIRQAVLAGVTGIKVVAALPPRRICACGAACWRVGGETGCIYVTDPND